MIRVHPQEVPSLNAYRQEYFARLQAGAVLVESVAPAALLVIWWLGSFATETSMLAHRRLEVWGAASVALVLLIVVMRRVTSLHMHGWLTVALLSITSAAIALLATPTVEGVMWSLPTLLLVPVVAAPFWIWMHKNLIACLSCYGLGSMVFLRIDAPFETVAGYAVLSMLGTMICAVVFVTIDRTRKVAYDRQQALHHDAHHDALTGLPSRRRFQELGLHVMATARERAQPVSISFIDLDHFKKINDEHSHAAGDRALAIFAEILMQQMQPGMVVARMGGEEFVILMPGMAQAEAWHFVDRMRQETAHRDMGGFLVTMSAGVVELRGEETLAHAMQRADQALLEAKRLGRNRVQ